MVTLKPGARLKSAVCDTEVMVIKGKGDFDLRCGGMLLSTDGADGNAQGNELFMTGALIGKRYVNEQASIELLCTKGGAGSLADGEQLMSLKQTEALPSSD